MVTFDELRNARFDGLRIHAQTWTDTMQQLDRAVSDFEFGVCGGVERAGWTGKTSGEATPELEATLTMIRIAALEARAMAGALDMAIESLTRVQLKLFTEVFAAAGDGFMVTIDGASFTVRETTPPPTPRTPEQQDAVQAKADWHWGRFQAILDEATQADSQFAAQLAKMNPAEIQRGGTTALTNARMDLESTFAKDPMQAAAWWSSLTEAERQTYLANFPYQIGSMDGIPATVRNQANQNAMNSRLAVLGPLVATGTATSREKREFQNLQKIQEVLAQNPGRSPAAQVMLLKFSARSADGEVVLSIGNPDTAKNTVVQVPGVNATIKDKLKEQVDRATKVQYYSDKLTDAPGDVASIVWLDYDAPEVSATGFGSALDTTRAAEGADEFNRFVNGMRATGPPGQHLTASGHSYGTEVIAEATKLQPSGLNVDDIVLIGSPGLDMEHASDLRHDPAHVWAGMSGDDMVAPWGWFAYDTLPNDPDFGAAHLPTNPGGHFTYWRDDGKWERPDTSLAAQANITMGRYDNPGAYPTIVAEPPTRSP